MSTINIELPDSLHQAAEEEAKKDHVTLNQLITLALAEKVSALKTVDYLSSRAKRAPTREQFLDILKKVPSVKPESVDKW